MHRSQRILLTAITSIIFLSSYSDKSHAVTFNNIKGWNNQYVYFGPDADGTTDGLDIDGEIGHPLTVWNPSANCGSDNNWTLSPSVMSGTLPPGLTMGDAPFKIEGIPTERGHWIVKLTSGDMTCDGESFRGFTQELRFHIKGSGKVVE